MQVTHVNIGMVHIKKIQYLVWWVYNNQNHCLALDVTGFTPSVVCNAIESKMFRVKK